MPNKQVPSRRVRTILCSLERQFSTTLTKYASLPLIMQNMHVFKVLPSKRRFQTEIFRETFPRGGQKYWHSLQNASPFNMEQAMSNLI